MSDGGRRRDLYTLGEEVANSITHGIGLILSVAALVILVVVAVHRGSAWHVVGFTIFGSTLILLYLASTLYHGIQRPRVKSILRRCDHAAIFLLIAGTYTPFLLTNLRGPWGWSLLGVLWGIAAVGTLFKAFSAWRFERLSVAAYLLMGWLGIIAVRQLFTALPPLSLLLLGVGGLVYTVGVVFYAWGKLPFGHAIWHLFVMRRQHLPFLLRTSQCVNECLRLPLTGLSSRSSRRTSRP